MTATQKYEAFKAVRAEVYVIEQRHIQARAQAASAAHYAYLEKQRDQVRKAGAGWSLLK
jgi:hypothetical protein